MNENRPSISAAPDGPYVVKDLRNLRSKNGPIEPRSPMSLCRCGKSSNKPFCDGTHGKVGFTSAKEAGRVADRRDTYVGKGITIHDNRGICAHAGICTDNLAAVFRLRQEPFVDPDGASAEEIIAVIKRCPSGALGTSKDGGEPREQARGAAIFVAPNGPYVVTGGPDLAGEERGEGASLEHYTLCRCGGSKNKPFCDGAHWNRKFDEHA